MLGLFIIKLDFFFWKKLQVSKEELVYWPAKALLSEIFKPLIIWYSHTENSVGYIRCFYLGPLILQESWTNGGRFQPISFLPRLGRHVHEGCCEHVYDWYHLTW